jgi:hypothetical protein
VKIAGKFVAKINQAERLLNKVDLLDERNRWVSYPKSLPGDVRKLSYVDEYRSYVNARLFDFSLVDRSVFQFKRNGADDISYCYYQSPFEAPTYRDFLLEQFGTDLAGIDEVGDSFSAEYELVVDTARLRKGVTPIRYDYSPALYEAGIHPAAHLHIGAGNDVRLCAGRLMNPLSFVLFVMRQMYPHNWRRFVHGGDASTICRAVREDLPVVEAAYTQPLDRLQLVLE